MALVLWPITYYMTYGMLFPLKWPFLGCRLKFGDTPQLSIWFYVVIPHLFLLRRDHYTHKRWHHTSPQLTQSAAQNVSFAVLRTHTPTLHLNESLWLVSRKRRWLVEIMYCNRWRPRHSFACPAHKHIGDIECLPSRGWRRLLLDLNERPVHLKKSF